MCLLFSLFPSIGHLLATTRLVGLPYCDHTLQCLLSLCVLHYLYHVLLREEQSDLQDIVAAVILGEDTSGMVSHRNQQIYIVVNTFILTDQSKFTHHNFTSE